MKLLFILRISTAIATIAPIAKLRPIDRLIISNYTVSVVKLTSLIL